MHILQVQVSSQDDYKVLLSEGILADIENLSKTIPTDIGKQIFIITDQTVIKLYEQKLRVTLEQGGFIVRTIVINGGEQDKNIDTALYIINNLISYGAQRRSTLVALGGGVITDIVGFVASIYMRGINYINIPTTLLAQVDASVGGKTGVNLPVAKNIVGSFHHPKQVIVDPTLLNSLADREIRQGVAEVIKVAIISSPDLFSFLEENMTSILQRNMDTLGPMIKESIRLKIELLEPDPYENDLRRVLNFGHTLGHALETAVGYEMSHGDAISIGMMAATRLAYNRGMCNSTLVERIEAIFVKAGLPISYDPSISLKVQAALREIALIRGGTLNVVLPVDIGHTKIVQTVQADELVNFIS